MKSLSGLAPELEPVIREMALLAGLHADSHRAGAGNVSQLLDARVADRLRDVCGDTATDWFDVHDLDQLRTTLAGGTGLRLERIANASYTSLVRVLARRALLVTRTGALLPAITESIRAGEDGRFLNVIEIDGDGARLRVLYGWHEFRSLPSFETPIHLAACALSIAQGIATPATLHAHTHHLIALGRHQRIAGSFGKLNAAAYTAADGLYRLHDGLIGVVPYLLTGTEAHFDACLEPMRQHQVVLWMNHGILIRAPSVARAYALLGLVEESAEAALWSLEGGALRLPDADVRPFLERHELADAYDHLFG